MLKRWLPDLPTGSFIGKENTSRVQCPACNQIDAATSLRQTEAYSIQDAISPCVVQRFKTCGQAIHGSTSIELQHEIDILNDNRRDTRALDQIKQHRHNFRLFAANSRLITCHTEVLTREARSHDGGIFWKTGQIRDIPEDLRFGKANLQNGGGCRIDLGKDGCLQTRFGKSQL